MNGHKREKFYNKNAWYPPETAVGHYMHSVSSWHFWIQVVLWCVIYLNLASAKIIYTWVWTGEKQECVRVPSWKKLKLTSTFQDMVYKDKVTRLPFHKNEYYRVEYSDNDYEDLTVEEVTSRISKINLKNQTKLIYT